MKIGFRLLALIGVVLIVSCSDANKEKEEFVNENIKFATEQTKKMLDVMGKPDKKYPRTIVDGKLRATGMYDWTPGFFPGSLWYLYELTQDDFWKQNATEWTETLEPLKTFTGHHDLGFMMYCSYGNAYRLTQNKDYEDIIIQSAKSLSTRFRPVSQAIQSWNKRKSWNDSIEWICPVIIDNMMNLELLTVGSRLSGNDSTANVAIAHANTTMKNQFRDDYGNFHVVDYDTLTGNVAHKMTCQGYSDSSTWSRGQAWAIYGYTMMYRETQDAKYLDFATKLADFYLNNLPEDLIPLWDFNVGQEGYNPEGRSYAVTYKEKLRDASAGAVTCSALFELGGYVKDKGYIEKATTMLKNLASPAYRANLGENENFILMHSVGSIPHQFELDVPLVYADYYFLEALVRYKNLK